MTGIILGFDNNTGTISADNGTRYTFTKDTWKENIQPLKNMKVDFAINEQEEAIDIYTIKDKAAENTSILLGLAAVVITFLFGFIGTLISRLALARQSFGSSLVPTAIHFLITLLVFIPIIGWIGYFIGTIYFMYKNYILATKGNGA